ncbi:MAG: diacylglycerol kinase family protein [Candidatus Bipolaricaulota bacterium]
MRRCYVVVNPASGRGAGGRCAPRIERALRAEGVEPEMAFTERPWHAVELAHRAVLSGFDVVVAVGGDGTANEVMNGLLSAKNAGRRATLGVVPVGRGNDFAFGVGIPRDLESACRVVAGGCVRTIDVGHVVGSDVPDGRYFGNGVGVGFDTVVGFEAQKLKHVRGFAAYFVGALRTMFLYFRAPLVRLRRDERESSQRALMISIMNGRRMGGGFLMAPAGRPDDGLLDLCIAGQVSRRAVLGLLPRFIKGTQGSHPAIAMERASRIEIVAEEGTLPAHADGETLCTAGTTLEIELLPQALDVLVDPASVIP